VTKARRFLLGVLLAFAFAFVGSALIRAGAYGLSLFIVMPLFLGALAYWVFRPETAGGAVRLGFYASLAAFAWMLLLGAEGLICILMTMPLAVPLAMIGSYMCFKLTERKNLNRGAALLLLLPTGLVWDFNAVPPVFEVRTSILIAARPERVWRHVVTFSELPEPHEWYFRAGLAYPRRARIAGTGAGAVRYCEFSTGPFVEPIEVWDEPRLLRFRVTENPAPMHEWSPYAHVLPKHLRGYLVSEHGQFLLTPLPNNRTLLEGTTWYRHGLWPAGYWRLWSDAIIHRIHLRVLKHIRNQAEASW
jgi:hypothetical protein